MHQVLNADQLDAAVAALAQALVQAGPEAVKATKALVQDIAGKDITQLLIERTVHAIAEVRVSPEGQEGIQAFLRKRKPDWLLPG